MTGAPAARHQPQKGTDMDTRLPEVFDPSTQEGTAEAMASSIAEGKCSHCSAKFLMGADHALIVDEKDNDLWCDDGRVKRPPKQSRFLLCFSCFDDEDYDPADPKPGRWQWGRC
jgi:hypothetical protein